MGKSLINLQSFPDDCFKGQETLFWMHKFWYFGVFTTLSHCFTTIPWLCLAHIRHFISIRWMSEWIISTENSGLRKHGHGTCALRGGGVCSVRHNADTLVKNSKFQNTRCTKTAQQTSSFLSYTGRVNRQTQSNKNLCVLWKLFFPGCRSSCHVTWTELEVPPPSTLLHGVISVWSE